MLHLVKRFRSSGVYRFFTDFGFTKQAISTAWRLLTDEDYQLELARGYLHAETDRDYKDGRLSLDDVERLNGYMENDVAKEYIRGFYTHIRVKLFDPPIVGKAIWAGVAVKLDAPEALLPLAISPVFRTIYTVSRMVKNRKKDIPYWSSLLVGMSPFGGGSGAYPVQMYFRNPELSTYLARSVASNVGRHFPLYGKKDSRLEHYFMKFVDIPASIGYEFNAAKTRIQDIYRNMRGRPKDN